MRPADTDSLEHALVSSGAKSCADLSKYIFRPGLYNVYFVKINTESNVGDKRVVRISEW
jgi:hypothetical protein